MPRLTLLVLVLTACSQVPTTDSSTTTTTTTTPTTTTTLAAADVYSLVSPSLAFVETAIGSGSAVLVDARTLVTNAHVVWPAETVTITFPGGPSGEIPVVGYDWMADLALLDVSSLSDLPEPATLDTTEQGPGSSIYLVGYPADDAETSSPAITAGIVSRTRTWEEAGITFIQSDALISSGQSGGALVDEQGRVIGISGLSVGDGFALALTAADLLARIESMRLDSDPHGLGGRTIADLRAAPGGESSVPYLLDETVFVFEGNAGDSVSIEIAGSDLLNADLVGPDGFVEATSGAPGVRVSLQATLILSGPYFVVVYPEIGALDSVVVSGVDTHLWADPDHGGVISIGSNTAGNGDYPGDLDWFQLDLDAGQTVTITATSINIDAALLVDLLVPENGSVFVSDSDSGGGVIGFDARVVFTAPERASYAVAVFDETGFGPGGYILTIEEGHR
ncbi:MAG: serine protease [Acidimicrobiia bacterium]